MIKELIDYLLNTAYKHTSVNYVSYKRDININDSHNYPSFQFIIENDSPLIEKQIVQGVITMKVDVDIIGFVSSKTSVIEVQDEALHIALDWMEKVQNDREYDLDIRDYSILGLSEFTDDSSAGVRLSIKLIIPSPINLCEYNEHFIEKEIPVKEELDLINGDECTNSHFNNETTTLKLNPIKLR